MTSRNLVWVFGYGSLIWRQDFPFVEARPAWVEGWTRRFWQGSHDHRGVATDPGRVVTLIEAPGERCDGRAFLVERSVFEHLDYREKNGYRRTVLTLCFADHQTDGITYVAHPGNAAFLGDAELRQIADQIRRCAGESGSNAEYLRELARALRKLGVHDPHVFDIESLL